jgi:ubiquinone/menaquinone biosynthesis C-methylase UbiE
VSEPDFHSIYREQNRQYEALIAREDYQGNLLRRLHQVVSFENAVVIDTGAGTGRLARMLVSKARLVYAFDQSHHMLQTARAELSTGGWSNWLIAASDHRTQPVAAQTADIVISGWSFCYLALNSSDDWPLQLRNGLDEIQRVLRAGGTAILIETLGTGYETPVRYPELEPYFRFLEDNGFQFDWIRTDYQFRSLEEASSLSAFFFGENLARKVIEQNWVILPECTGIWWKKW